ncbi:MAG: HAD family phosphatase [Proteiniphilum sp.]|nr:HAD family phosphatase [Proteiniphilum sp.]MDD3910016.1 HAD family phosphatase [Proteiniphilum sp.]MDD4416618.1 HAD family phosphatase [Proteiniphilum sp.]
MLQLKNIILDFGGVLIDWNPAYLYRKVFNKEEEMDYFLDNVCKPDWNVLQDAGRPLAEATAMKQQEFPRYKEEIAMFYGRWEEMLGGTFEENTRLIKPLKEKYKVYGLTNWSAETLPIAMARYDFFRDMDGIVVSGEEKLVKPDKKLYQILLDRYSIKPSESLFIDDNIDNVKAAKAMGFHIIHLTEAVNLEQELKNKMVL